MADAVVEVVNNPERSRFEVEVDGGLAQLAYFVLNERVVYMVHTEVPRAAEGHGIAAQLAKTALDWARGEGLRVIPRCPYVRSYIARHPQYDDLVVDE